MDLRNVFLVTSGVPRDVRNLGTHQVTVDDIGVVSDVGTTILRRSDGVTRSHPFRTVVPKGRVTGVGLDLDPPVPRLKEVLRGSDV